MTEQERIVVLDERQKSMEQRLEKTERLVDNINSLTISVERLSIGFSSQVDTLKEMNLRLSKIENEPRDTMRHVYKQIITALVTGVITAIFCNV